MKNPDKEILFLKAVQLNDSDLLMNGLRAYWPNKNDKNCFEEKNIITDDLNKLKALALQDGDFTALKRAIFYINNANKYYELDVDMHELKNHFTLTTMFNEMYSYLCLSYLEFLDKQIINCDEAEKMFSSLKVDIKKSSDFPFVVQYTAKLAKYDNSDFEKIENIIYKNLYQAGKVYAENKEDASIQERYFDSLNFTYQFFIKEHSKKVNLSKFKRFYSNNDFLTTKNDTQIKNN